jgi:preprotein translocase subunit SecG
MDTVIIVIHLMVVVALVGVVLLQRSEGGALGIGGGGFMSVRGASNALTRTTAILAAAFFATSIALGVLAKLESRPGDVLDRIPAQGAPGSDGKGVFDQLAPKADGAARTGELPKEPVVPTK